MFLVMMNPLEEHSGELKTFIDVAQRALDILMLHNLLADLRSLDKINTICERAAAELAVRPEEIEIDLGTHRYRYIKSFAIRRGDGLLAEGGDASVEHTNGENFDRTSNRCAGNCLTRVHVE
jgi:hypothetical protein